MGDVEPVAVVNADGSCVHFDKLLHKWAADHECGYGVCLLECGG
jgi:hypothetical protein